MQSDEEGMLNVGTGVETPVGKLFRLLKKATGSSQPDIHGAERPGDVRRSALSALKARRRLGVQPKVGLEEGLKRTVEWYRKRIPS
jgi:UDP-glucose 4-epimerase